MGNLLGYTDHLQSVGSGDVPGSDSKSRIGQGTGVPKTPKETKPPRSVSGTHSYGIRHPTTKAVPAVGAGAAVDKMPKVFKAPKAPKL